MSVPHNWRTEPRQGPSNRIRSLKRLGSLLLALCVLTGCNSSAGPALTPVSGVVTLENMPLAQARVMFIPQGDTLGHGGAAVTGDDGRYEVVAHRSNNRKGLLPGDYKVVVTRLLMPDGTPLRPGAAVEGSGARESVPEPYCRRDITPLIAAIGTDAKAFDFPLKKSTP